MILIKLPPPPSPLSAGVVSNIIIILFKKLRTHFRKLLPLYIVYVSLLCVMVVSLTLVYKFHSSYIGMNVRGSAYENGCMVDGTCATAAD